MSYRIPSRKVLAGLAVAGCWNDDDVVLDGTDGHGCAMRIARAGAAVPAALVRRWLLVKDDRGEPRLRVVRDFVSSDGYLFSVETQSARFGRSARESSQGAPTS